MNSKVLILKLYNNSFEIFYTNELRKICDVSWIYKSDSLIRKVWTRVGFPLERIWYGSWSRCLDQYDLIIVFDCIKNSKIIRFLRNRTRSRIILWQWNPISSFFVKIIGETKDLCEHWTFNPTDAQKYSLRLNNQFYFYPDKNALNEQGNGEGVFFAGYDKGRYSVLLGVVNTLSQAGINMDINILAPKSGYKPNAHINIMKEFMSYEEIRRRISSNRCILEIVQKNQNGLTARALEALFFKKKLITNNKSIQQYDFYKDNNIYVLGEDNRSIEEFYHLPYDEVAEDILYKYSAEGWLKNFSR